MEPELEPEVVEGDEQLSLDAPPESLTAAGDNTDPAAADAGDERWHCIVTVENVRSTDGREFTNLGTRPLPLPLQYLTATTFGHDDAELGGRIETLVRDPTLAPRLAEAGFESLAPGTELLVAEGSYDAGDNGQELRRLVNSQMLRWVSADIEVLSYEYVWDSTSDPDYDAPDAARVTAGNIMGTTVCPFPAFPQCVIAPLSMDLVEAATQGMAVAQEVGLIDTSPTPVSVAASGGPLLPPAFWFEDPQLTGPTPLTIGDDGRVYGHAATWDTDHIGLPGRQVRPPHSASSYAYFRTGEIRVTGTDGPARIACGQITIGTSHAPQSGPNATVRAATAHYDETGTAVVDVASGEDEYGIWVAGALRPDVTDEQERALRAASLSGDWRTIGGNLEFVACLAVNVPGFPIPRTSAGFARNNGEDEQLALVAAGVLVNDPLADRVTREVAAQLAPYMGYFDELHGLVVERMSATIRP